jgi:molybdopterin-binding protein
MTERVIGKVISVDSFRVFIKLDDDLKSLYKSGYEDIFEVARINSYIIIPIGSDKIVAMITSVKNVDETELKQEKEAIFLTKSARYVVATMVGTIIGNKKYIQGVYNYPVLDNPVWYVLKQDLDNIFDHKSGGEIDYLDDYYLPIGTSPAFSDYQVKINPDKFFGKHAAILGNTGSGKSCTLTSILQSLFDFSYNGSSLNSAHVIIFDTNGEYQKAFKGTAEEPYKNLSLVNPLHIDKDGLKVPYWFMNFNDYDYLFEPSANTQTPILKRAIALAKNKAVQKEKPLLDVFIEKGILSLIDASPDELKKKKKSQKYGNWIFNNKNEVLGLAEAIPETDDIIMANIKANLLQLGNDGSLTDELNALNNLKAHYQEYSVNQSEEQIALDKNIDLPIWFDFKELINRYFDEAIKEQDSSSGRLKEFVSTLRLRLQSYLTDDRIGEPLLLNKGEEIQHGLAKFLAFILGDTCKVYQEENNDEFTTFIKNKANNENVDKLNLEKPSQITIIDMSLLPYDVLETITGLIGRLILEFVSRMQENERGKTPIVLALEEAQNYIPEKNKGDRESVSKKVFERIAREGRKYGVSLLISSQRPSELSKTVLSQCNSFIIHRLQNPEDQKYIRQLVSAANEDILKQLPILPQQHAIIMGDAVRTPVQTKIKTAKPTPNSNNPEFISNWLINKDKTSPNYIGICEAWEKGTKYSD